MPDSILTLMRASWAMLRPSADRDTPDEHDVRLRRLHQWHADDGSITQADLEYWAERFLRLHVRSLAGCSFERYLMRPEYYERIASARRALTTSESDSSTTHEQSQSRAA